MKGGKTQGPFLAMAGTYFLGAFNDNFYKQAAMLLAVAAGKSGLQGTATILFSLPFILFSAWAGWFADRFAKRQVVISAKLLELLAMLVGAYGLLYLDWGCMLAMVFIMALQSTLFGPALNGSIPELFPDSFVPTANAFIKMASTVAILLGIALAGIGLDQQWLVVADFEPGRLLVAGAAVVVSLLGLAISLGVPGFAAAGSSASFPWLAPFHSLQDLWHLRHDPQLLHAVLCDGFFYFTASFAMLLINLLGLVQFGWSRTLTSLLSVALMVGVCLGSLLVARLAGRQGQRWYSPLFLSCLAMGLALLLTWGSSLWEGQARMVLAFASLLLAGVGGGAFLIPLTSFIQLRPRAEEKGRIIAASNFTAFSAILLAGQLYKWVHQLFAPSTLFAWLAGGCLLVAWLIRYFLRKQVEGGGYGKNK